MKKHKGFLFPVLSIPLILGMATSCGGNSPSQDEPTSEIVKIEIQGDKKTTYHYGDSFTLPTIIATDKAGKTYDVTSYCRVTGFSSYKVGKQTIVIQYYSFTLSYEINMVNEIASISVEGQKTSFEVGEEFSLGGGKVYAIYDDGSKVELNEEEYEVSGFSSSEITSSATITISSGDFSTTYTYEVKEASSYVINEIKVEEQVTKFEVGDPFERPKVIAVDTYGNEHDVSDYATISGFDSSSAGEVTITVSYKGFSVTYKVTIVEAESGGTSGVDIPEDTISGDFSIINDTSGVEITPTDGVYLVDDTQEKTAKGVIALTLKGKLSEGQIQVNAPEIEVEFTLNGVSISNSTVSPIDVISCDKIEISAKKNKANYIYDNRSTSVVDEENDQYGGAIYVEDGDLKLKGKGQLYLKSLSNNGVHAKDDVTVKNLGLVVNAVNNGIKGNDSITFEEAPKVLIECGNDGLKTSSTDISSKGNQRGSISILGGELEIQSYGDAIDAAYDLIIDNSVDEADPTVTYSPIVEVYTGSLSSFKPSNYGVTTSFYSGNSQKGLKSTHDLNINNGEVYVSAYDDAIHGNKYSDNTLITYETGESAVGNVTISGGKVEVSAGDDGVHADGLTKISGGYVNVTKSTEGVEGFEIEISGGETYVFATDDGLNASGSSSNSSDGKITVSGGILDVTVKASGDVDGIDSNGTYTQTGGTVIVRGPAGGGAWSLDTTSDVTLNGGTLVVVGGIEASGSGGFSPWYASGGHGPGGGGGGPGGMGGGSLIVGSDMKNATSSTGKAIGTFKVTVGEYSYTYTNIYSYSGSVIMYSEFGTPTISKIN